MRTNSWFFAAITPMVGVNAIQDHLRLLSANHPGAMLRTFEGCGQFVSVLCSDPTDVIENPQFWLRIVRPRPPDRRLRRALEATSSRAELRAIGTGSECHDSAILAIDKKTGEVLATTDPLNVAKIFHGEIGRTHLFASSVFLFPKDLLKIDLGSVASYVLNGSCLNNHTAFEDVRVLERAAHHEFSLGSHRTTTYWNFLPGAGSTRTFQPKSAALELWERTVESVARLTSGKQVLLSLSGGYDSGVLLGILGAHLKHRDVTCFSYAYGTPKPGSDAEVAARQAALYGYKHITVSSYSGDLLHLLDSNAAVSETLRCPSYEIEAFARLRERFDDMSETVMLFGDECFGWGSYRLNNQDDILGAISLKSSSLLKPLSTLVGNRQMERLRNGLETEYEELRRKISGFATPDDAKDFLYLDQRLQFYLLPLRTFVAGRWFPVAMPLISPQIVDFVAGVPARFRIDKSLLKRMARRHFPELFGIPRATRGQFHPDFSLEVFSARDTLRKEANTRGWNIDGLCGPAELVALLDDFRLAGDGRRGGLSNSLKKTLKMVLANSRLLDSQQHWLRRLGYNEFARSPGQAFVILNLLSLASSLARRHIPS